MDGGGRGSSRLRSLGNYTLIDRLGTGGMGVVYRALDRRSGSLVALKLLHEHVIAEPSHVERFRREAHVAALLRSPYTVHVLDFGQEDGQYYLVSELVEGNSLAELLRAGPFDPLTAVSVATQVALALDEAESHHITHRDIKPENILVGEDGSVKVADFGIADIAYLSGLTAAGSFVGSVAYAAPEQHEGTADIRSDIYALGCVLFEMLAGRRPFDAPTATGLMRQHGEQRPPLESLEGTAPELVAIVARCMAKDPSERFQHASEVAGALEASKRAVAGVASAGAVTHDNGATAQFPLAAPAVPSLPPIPASAVSTPIAAAAMAPTNEGAAGVPPAPPAPPSARAEGSGGFPVRFAIVAAAVAVIAVAGAIAAMALGGRGDDDDPSDSGQTPGATATMTASASASASVTASASAVVAGGSPSPAASPTDAGASPTATVAVVAPTATAVRAAPTATPAPPTATPVPPTATPVPQPSFQMLGFSTAAGGDNSPPGNLTASGGSIGCNPNRPTNIYGWVRHANVPAGASLVGRWSFEGADNGANPAVPLNSTTGVTFYNFSNANGLPSGLYQLSVSRAGSVIATGTVRVAC